MAHKCDVPIRDEASIDASISNDDETNAGVPFTKYTILGSPNSSLPMDLKSQLENRTSSETCGIKVVSWSEALMDDLAEC